MVNVGSAFDIWGCIEWVVHIRAKPLAAKSMISQTARLESWKSKLQTIMSAGLTWTSTWMLQLRDVFGSWFGYEPLTELEFAGRTEVDLSRDGYAIRWPSNRLRQATEAGGVAARVANPADLAFPPRRNIILGIDSDLCFRRIVELPMGPPAALGEALRLDLLRVTPFDPASIITAHRKKTGQQGARSVQIEQLVFKRRYLESLSSVLASRRLELEAIVFRDEGGAIWPTAVAADGRPYGIDRRARWFKFLMASAAATIFAGAMALAAAPRVSMQQDKQVTSEIESLKPRVDKILAEVDAIKKSSLGLRELSDWKQGSLGLPVIVEEISRLLPDEAYLETLSFDSGVIVIEGQAATPESLISALEGSDLFAEVAFAAPVYRNTGETRSHFSIHMKTAPIARDPSTAQVTP